MGWFDADGNWHDGTKPKPKPPPPSDGGGGGGGDGGGTSSSGTNSSQSASAAERKILEERARAAFAKLFPESRPGEFKMPKELLDAAIKGKWTLDRISGWVRTHMKEAWAATTVARTRADAMNKSLDAIFGGFPKGSLESKSITALIKRYVYGSSDDMYKFIDDVVTNPKSKFFLKMFPGWEVFYARVSQEGFGNKMDAVTEYYRLKGAYTSRYRDTIGNPDADIENELLQKAIEEGWSLESFDNWVKANDPAWLQGGGAKERGEEFDDLWGTLFGDDAASDPALRAAFQKGSKTIAEFFSKYIEDTEAFKALHPGYEAWKQGQFGDLEGAELPVDPMLYFRRRQELKELYEIYTDTPGATNDELVDKALTGNWSNERFKLEFKSVDPLYKNTAEARVKTGEFTRYWKELFGVNAVPDAALMSTYLSGNEQDPSAMFDQIRNTSIFRSQYGSWDAFVTAQDAAGNTGAILNNPAMYKKYQDAFRDAFANVGLTPPEGFEGMFFRSGMDDSEIGRNLEAYIQSDMSQQWMSGQQSDLQTAAGLGDKTAGGDLRIRMSKALQQHRTFAQSTFTAPRAEEEQGSGFITQRI